MFNLFKPQTAEVEIPGITVAKENEVMQGITAIGNLMKEMKLEVEALKAEVSEAKPATQQPASPAVQETDEIASLKAELQTLKSELETLKAKVTSLESQPGATRVVAQAAAVVETTEEKKVHPFTAMAAQKLKTKQA